MKAKHKPAHTHSPHAKVVKPEPWHKDPRLPYALGALAALAMVFWAYSPSFHGPFLFDDQVLKFALPSFNAPLHDWVVGVRPMLMFTYWVNAQLSGNDPYSYHLLNVLIHCFASCFVFLIVRRLLEWAAAPAQKINFLAGFAGLLFLLHPVQTEAVAYLAGRSECLSVALFLGAWTLFLYRKSTGISWLNAIQVLAIFGAALLSKEHTIALPAVLMLTDFWWNPGFSLKGIVRNWKLYAPMALGAAGGLALFWSIIFNAKSAGFGLKDFTWYQYFFTQCRALFVYIGEFLFPAWLTADWDFPVSKTIFDQGAIVGLIVLLALAAAAWKYRRRFPLACFGYFAFLLLMAPTSSILPIQDPVAERRLYLGMPGLLLILVDLLGRWNVKRTVLSAACAAVLLAAAIATHARAGVWADPVALWQDTVKKSPAKFRDHFQLANAYADAGFCPQATDEYARAMSLPQPIPAKTRYNLLIDWGLAYDCGGKGQPNLALAKFREAIALERTAHAFTQIASVYGEQSKWAEAMDALVEAEKIDPNFAYIYTYRGIIYYKTKRCAEAVKEYEHALTLDRTLQPAMDGLVASQNCVMRPSSR